MGTKWVAVDLAVWFAEAVPAYHSPGEVTFEDRPLEDDRWDREVRD